MSEFSELSERELEVLRLVATGASNKKIAQDLSISKNTVKVHIRNIFSKTGVASRTEAAIYAVQTGLVDPAGVPLPDQAEQNVSTLSKAWAARPLWQKIALIGAGMIGAILTFGLGAILIQNISGLMNPTPTPDIVVADLNRWQERAPLRQGRAGLALAAYENQIYAISGEYEGSLVDNAERYDPSVDQWTDLAPKPTPVRDVMGVVFGGRIYVPGGATADGTVSDALEIYNPSLDQWESGASLPEALSAYGAVAYEGRLYIFGGWNGDEFVDSVLRYDPLDDQWESLTAMPTARGYLGAAESGGRIYVIGGSDGTNLLTTVEEYNAAAEFDGTEPWRVVDPMPAGRAKFGLASVAGIIHLIGGEGDIYGAVPYKFFPQDGRWEEFESIGLTDWESLALVPLETKIHVVGGTVNGTESATHVVYEAIYTISFPIFR